MTISVFSGKMGRWHYLWELFLAGNIVALVLALAQAQSWHALSFSSVMQHVLFINWILLAFAAFSELLQSKTRGLSMKMLMFSGFVLLQALVLFTTLILNVLIYFGENFSLTGLSADVLTAGVVLNLSYGVLLGAFCFRYLYLREQWGRQHHSELNSRIQAMQARIHPHFLFNSLNNVISLIAIDPDKAEQMLLNLSRLFRASFQELKLVSLKDEIDLCQRYLAIEQMRLGDRLNVEWKLADIDQYAQVQIPLLTLQPLLENSIFHGVEKILTKSTINILIEILQNQINIVITNPYTQDTIKLRQGNGIAIENVKQRLEAYYGQHVTFQTYAGEGMYTTVVQYQYK
ncbi:histidine kinase [Acinetobacter sp. ANC 4945]|nr:histidine kinase [Acinetobacter amyesii]MCL6247323.1 histidine kinase [Acinetobacter amyesii]